jgi:L-ascorbate metabolism protein UlaG (beta-lactamase superfamily)
MADGADAVRGADTAADRIVFLGHATVLIEVDGVRLLTDPLLRSGVAHLRRQTPMVDRSVFAAPDAVLISHLHHDHLDLPSLRILGRETPVIVPAGAGAWLRQRGFSTVTELSLGDVAQVGALTVGAVEARHDGRRPGGPSAETLGYLISGRHTVYFAGDTELFAGMANSATSLDLALLPVAGWGPTLGPGHMDPLDAARAVAAMQPRLAIPMHWGTLLPVGLSRRYRARLAMPPRLFAEHVARLAPSVEVRVLTPGESTVVDC